LWFILFSFHSALITQHSALMLNSGYNSDMSPSSFESRRDAALSILRKCNGVLVALSGGVDSAALLALAAEALPGKVAAATALSETYPPEELPLAQRVAKSLGVPHHIVETTELQNPTFTANPPDRCYHCKRELVAKLRELADKLGLEAIGFGATVDDLGEHRPGHRAVAEGRAITPLLDAGITKQDARTIARVAGLPVWDRPSSACLASRFPYGTAITEEGLRQVAQVESAVRSLGFGQVRCRRHGLVGRLEIVPSDWDRLTPDMRQKLAAIMHGAGFVFAAIDMEGYRSGAMDEALGREQRESQP
jgi:pyridinium-3,5-biscarboxylic acid mononucleotide sulfurtransferase